MRNSNQVFDLLTKIVNADERIRVMTLEGSRVNPNVKQDPWQDYDITFLVTDVESYLTSDKWLEKFGERIFVQKPEGMSLYPPDFPNGWFSYLMLFPDGIKIDLTLVPIADSQLYFEQDPLIQILIDKDGQFQTPLEPTDEMFWVQAPSAQHVEDCANEFYFVSTYVKKGLLRKELLYANGLLEQILRPELLRMLGYLVGARAGFPINLNKQMKRLPQLLSADETQRLYQTYRLESLEQTQIVLNEMMVFFEEVLQEVCQLMDYPAPNFYETIKLYHQTLETVV